MGLEVVGNGTSQLVPLDPAVEEYWNVLLYANKAPPPLLLPQGATVATDAEKSPSRSAIVEHDSLSIPAKTVSGLEGVCSQHSSFLAASLLTALVALLHKYCNEQTSLTVGVMLPGRVHKFPPPPRVTVNGMRQVPNLVPVNVTTTNAASVADLLASVTARLQGALAHASAPFPLLVEKLVAATSGSKGGSITSVKARDKNEGTLLPSVVLDFSEDVDPSTTPSNGHSDTVALLGYTPAVYVHVRPGAGAQVADDGSQHRSLDAHFYLNVSEIDPVVARAMPRHLAGMMAAFVGPEGSAVPLHSLDYLDPKEKERLFLDFNRTAREFPNCCVHQLVERAAARHPDKVAVVFGPLEVTYRRLNEMSNQLAHYLRTKGAGHGKFVGLFLERGVEMIVGLLAILKAGSPYIPMDPVYPRDRIAMMMEDAACTLVVTSSDLKARLPTNTAEGGATSGSAPNGTSHSDGAVTLICLDEEATLIGDNWKEDLVPDAEFGACTPEDLAYAIFTSGSTGRPKGVQIKHVSVVNLLASEARLAELSESDVLVAVSTICFDIAGLELFMPLMAGARLVIASREVAGDGDKLRQLMRTSGVTVMQATPATWRMLLQAGWTGSPSLTVLCGGEALPRDLALHLVPIIKRLLNVYGPTETCIWSTTSVVDLTLPLSIGFPLDNTSIYILDERLRPVPVGMPGELHIGGVGLSPGYLGRPDLTADKFIPNPYATWGAEHGKGGRPLGYANDKIYKTGDLAAWNADGSIRCLGRIDHQVKVRGYRVELEEIEAALSLSSMVEHAVVDARPDASGTMRLVGYLLLSEAYLQAKEDAKAFADAERAHSEDDASESLENGSVDRPGSVDASNANGSSNHMGGGGGGGHSKDKDKPGVTVAEQDLEEVGNWGAIYDEAYASRNAVTDDPTLNFSGYDNSYTPRVPHKAETVREWVEFTVERILELKPSSVLELGCGNGMILLRTAPRCARYIGTDLSGEAIAYVGQVLRQPRFHLPHVTLDECGAHESLRFREPGLDTIVCNGVSMYFPSLDYLMSVTENALDALQPGGVFFLGDVRNARLLRQFHASVQLSQLETMVSSSAGGADASGPVDPLTMSTADLSLKAHRAARYEKELLVDPVFFAHVIRHLPQCSRVVVQLKRGRVHSEFTMYRYDVYFYKAGAPSRDGTASAGDVVEVDYRFEVFKPESHNLAALEERLTSPAPKHKQPPAILAITGISDARLQREEILVEYLYGKRRSSMPSTVRELLAALDAEVAANMAAGVYIDPEELYLLGDKCGYRVEMVWSPVDGKATKFDVLFVRKNSYPGRTVRPLASASLEHHQQHTKMLHPWEQYTNKGINWVMLETWLKEGKDVGRPLDPGDAQILKELIRRRLPEYMVPAIFLQVPRIPMTQNGKVDRKALPDPGAGPSGGRPRDQVVQPVGEHETTLAAWWGEMLDMSEVSANDDFFEVGGHSLMAMQLVGKVRKKWGVKLSLAGVAETPVLRDLAALIATRAASQAAGGADAVTSGDADDDGEGENAVHVVRMSELPYEIRTTGHLWIPMSDGTRLAATLWQPENAKGPVPAVVEVLPYRRGDNTLEIDSMTYPFLAGWGFACLRVDVRGTGDSEGAIVDEYTQQQIEDACEVVEWAAEQSWCDGTVGLMGMSWGGFTALQVAALNPPSLKAIITVCSTDDRYADDMHYMGGCLLNENLAWGSLLMHTAALPPDPLVVGKDVWMSVWKQRLEGLQPPHGNWMRHPDGDDPYWLQGSVRHMLQNITVPVLAISGMRAGGYANSILRLAANLGGPFKAWVGPWSHNYPHISPLGPQGGFLAQAVRWFREHLSGADTGVMSESQFSMYMERPTERGPTAQPTFIPGDWVSVKSYKRLLEGTQELSFSLAHGGALVAPSTSLPASSSSTSLDGADGVTAAPAGEGDGCQLVHTSMAVGQRGGRWFTFGVSPDNATDQRDDDAMCCCYTSPATEKELLIFGSPRIHFVLADASAGQCDTSAAASADWSSSSSGPGRGGQLVARLVCVAPNGVSTRLGYGVVNLDKVDPGRADVTLTMNLVLFRVPANHRLRVALSSAYWPIFWPSASSHGIQLVTGASKIFLPVLRPEYISSHGTPLRDPEIAPPVHTHRFRKAMSTREQTYDDDTRTYSVRLLEDEGSRKLVACGKVLDTCAEHNYSIAGGDPLSARAAVKWATQQSRGDWQVKVEISTSLSADAHKFFLETKLDAYCGSALMISRKWDEQIQR